MNIWYAIPTANLERARLCVHKWRRQGYRVALWLDQPMDLEPDYVRVAPVYPGYFVAVNELARALVVEKGAEIVVTGGDDIDPDPNQCADRIGGDFVSRFPDLCGVMQPTGDSLPLTTRQCGSPWLGREWIVQANGGRGAFWPGYRHYYGDVELKHVAQRLKRLWQRPDLCQYHDQWRRHGGVSAMTDYQRRNSLRYFKDDRHLFRWRHRSGFPVRCRPWWERHRWPQDFFAAQRHL